MRKNILAAGVTFLALAILLAFYNPQGLLFSVPISLLNILLGLITRSTTGVQIQPSPSEIRLIVDRAVMRASIYQVVFLRSRLVFKRLSSVMVTVVLALVLAIVGLELLAVIGALMGGITGFSLQEFFTQRTRNAIASQTGVISLEKNDIGIDYKNLSEVRLARNRHYLLQDDRSIIASLPKKYSEKMRVALNDILGEKFVSGNSVGPVETTKK